MPSISSRSTTVFASRCCSWFLVPTSICRVKTSSQCHVQWRNAACFLNDYGEEDWDHRFFSFSFLLSGPRPESPPGFGVDIFVSERKGILITGWTALERIRGGDGHEAFGEANGGVRNDGDHILEAGYGSRLAEECCCGCGADWGAGEDPTVEAALDFFRFCMLTADLIASIAMTKIRDSCLFWVQAFLRSHGAQQANITRCLAIYVLLHEVQNIVRVISLISEGNHLCDYSI